LWSYLGLGWKWLVQVYRLVLYAMFLLPGFLQVRSGVATQQQRQHHISSSHCWKRCSCLQLHSIGLQEKQHG
jgi:hypothetical protein